MAERPRGRCKVCGRTVSLRKDGTVQGHGVREYDPNQQWCAGAWELPAEETD